MVRYLENSNCPCGRIHSVDVDAIAIGKGAIERLPEFVEKYGAVKPFLLADRNTFAAAGERVCSVLDRNGIAYSKYIFSSDNLEPDEHAAGSAVMHFDHSCDLIIGIGSGVINDIGKILSSTSGRKYIVVATAPSMDGYASATSSMSMGGLKVSLNSCCADVIIGDTDVLRNAPLRMLQSGLGDMLAKYVSLAEWRIAHLITGEYYCERVAELMRNALVKCRNNAEALLRRDDAAVEAVFEGLVIGGIAMAYAGVSRPASGVEHYFSHIWDMRGLEFGTPVDLHGIQCAIGTLLAVKLYDKILMVKPDYQKAKNYVDAFSFEDWKTCLTAFLGKGADAMIAQEAKDGKYDKNAHLLRFNRITEHWDKILDILDEELPAYHEMADTLKTVGISCTPAYLGIDSEMLQMSFKATKDIRDKYVLSRLAWDLGILDELCELL